MNGEPVDAPYTLRDLGPVLGLSRGVISGLVNAGFVTPGRGPRNELRFTFRDVVLLRTAFDLQAAKIPRQRLLKSLRLLRDRLPPELPLSGLRIQAVGNEVAVRLGDAQWEARTGQLLMDFAVAGTPGAIAILPQAGRAAEAREARAEGGKAHGGEATGRQAQGSDEKGGDGKGSGEQGIGDKGGAPKGRAPSAAEWYARGQHLEERDAEAAMSAYRQALALAPDHVHAYVNLGALLCEAGRCADAVALYDEALRTAPDSALVHFNAAIALEDQHRDAEALAHYERCLVLDPGLADAHYNAARLCEKLGDRRGALRHYSSFRRLERPGAAARTEGDTS